MLIRSWMLLGGVATLLMFGSCRRAAPAPEVTPTDGGAVSEGGRLAGADEQFEERWVQPGAAAGGDGTRENPHGSISEALESAPGRPLHLRLLAGVHVGAWELPAGTILEGARDTRRDVDPERRAHGAGDTRLQAPEEAAIPLVHARGAVTLRRLTLEGGSPTLVGRGPWELDDVTLKSGACLSLQGGRLRARGLTLMAAREGATCLEVAGDAVAELTGVFLEGPWHLGFSVGGSAKVNVRGLRARGAAWPVRQRGGALEVEGADLAGEGEAGLYVAGGLLQAHDVQVEGYDYGIMAGREATLTGGAFRLKGARRAGLALVGAQTRITGLEVSGVRGEGAFAGIQMIGGRAELKRVEIKDVSAAGLSQRDGELTTRGLSIEGVRASADGSEGAGLSVRLGTAVLQEGVRIVDVGGPGAWVAESGTLVAPNLSISDANWAGVVVETGAKLEVEALEVRRTPLPALLVTERSSAKVSRMVLNSEAEGDASAAPGAIVAACEEGAQIHLGTIEGGTRPILPCLHALSDPEAAAR